MVNLPINSTPEQDAAVVRYVSEFNTAQSAMIPGWVNVTPIGFMRGFILDYVNNLVATFKQRDKVTKGEAYNKATPEEQATIDAILAKYM